MWNIIFPWLNTARENMTYDYREWDRQYTAEAKVPAVQEAEKEVMPTVQEDVSAMQALLNRIVNKAVESTDLAKHVAELTEEVHRLREEMVELRHALEDERKAHAATQQELSDVRYTLDKRETTIHDLMEERDIVVRQRDEARQDRDGAKQEIARWEQAHNEVFAKLTDTEREKQRLQEQLDAALAKINGLKAAFGALAA